MKEEDHTRSVPAQKSHEHLVHAVGEGAAHDDCADWEAPGSPQETESEKAFGKRRPSQEQTVIADRSDLHKQKNLAIDRLLHEQHAEFLANNKTATTRLCRVMDQKSPRTRRIYHIGEKLIEAAIMLSFFNIGVCHEWKSLSEGDTNFCGVSEQAFSVVFAIEFMIKFALLKFDYFKEGLHIVDFIAFGSAMIDAWLLPLALSFDVNIGGISTIRIIRLLRLLRMVKVLEIKRELYVVVQGILGSMKALVWIMVLMFIVLYVSAILFQDLAELYKAPTYYDSVHQEDRPYELQQVYFPHLSISMLTLWSMCIGVLWKELADPAYFAQPYLLLLFIGFFAFTSFGLLNVIIGILTEKTAEASHIHALEDIAHQKQERLKEVKRVVSLLEDLDTNGNGLVSLQEMETNASLKGEMAKMHLPAGFEVGELFMMIDVDGSGFVDPQEFMSCMLRLTMSDSNFQRTCMQRLGFGRIMAKLNYMEAQFCEIR